MSVHEIARRAAEKGLLRDRCELIEAVDTPGTFNESTWEVDYGDETVAWSGPCAVHTAASSRTGFDFGSDIQVSEDVVLVPLSAPALEPGSIVRIVDAEDPELVDVEMTVVRSIARSSSVLRRLVTTRTVPFASTETVS